MFGPYCNHTVCVCFLGGPSNSGPLQFCCSIILGNGMGDFPMGNLPQHAISLGGGGKGTGHFASAHAPSLMCRSIRIKDGADLNAVTGFKIRPANRHTKPPWTLPPPPPPFVLTSLSPRRCQSITHKHGCYPPPSVPLPCHPLSQRCAAKSFAVVAKYLKFLRIHCTDN